MIPKFSQMPYSRPNISEFIAAMTELTQKFTAADSYEKAKALFLEQDKLSGHMNTLNALVTIRHSINTKDVFYADEQAFWDETNPQLQEYTNRFKQALLATSFREEFEKDFGKILFLNSEIEQRAFAPALIPLMQEENKLCNEYDELIASAQIPFRGGVYTLSQLTPFKNDADDALRFAAWKADGQWYKDHQDKLDDIFDRLVKVRDAMGKALGYDNYLPLGYDRMGRNCYDRNDVDKFRKAVQKYLVPIASGIYQEQAKRLGKSYPMSFADNALEFRSGNPKPSGTPEDILSQGMKFYSELSPETKEFFATMLDRELLDVLSTEGKQAGGYCEGILDYGVPFIFANFNGTQGDVSVVTHEAGHAFAYWMNRTRVPSDQSWPSMEGCEVHSMSMEFFSWPWAEGFFGKDTRKFYYSHLAEALTFIPYGTMVDHFQHIVYEHPEYTPAQRHAAWKELLGIYQPWMKLDSAIPFYAEGQGWQRQLHIYTSPLYYIDYCLAQTVSLEFWAMMQKDFKQAWEHYMTYTCLGGTKVFTELLKDASIDSPFNEETLKGVAEAAETWLSRYDLTGLE